MPSWKASGVQIASFCERCISGSRTIAAIATFAERQKLHNWTPHAAKIWSQFLDSMVNIVTNEIPA
jgi:hypothetical protein